MLDSLRRLATLPMPEWLSAGINPERVHNALVRHVPEFASGELVLRDCTLRRLRLKGDTNRWSGVYELTVDGAHAEQSRVVGLRGTLIPPGAVEPDHAISRAFGSDGWHCYLPELRLEFEMQPPETELAGLPLLTDPREARVLLEQSLRAGTEAYRDLQIQACTPKVMRHKPGSRCTILYHLDYGAELARHHGWPEIVVAKTYAGDKGFNAYNSMRALWSSTLATSSAVTIAEPLAYLPDMKVLVQGPIHEEQTLKTLIRSAMSSGTSEALHELHDYTRKTAAGLAALHQAGVDYGETVTWEDELAEIRESSARLGAAIPELNDAATPLLARLETLAAEYPADAPGPAHRSFRPAQVLLHKGKIGFIDFDGFCQAEPAMDLALFMAGIKNIGLSESHHDEDHDAMGQEARLERLTLLEALCETFLDEYMVLAPVSRQRITLWESLDLLNVVVGSWTKIKPERIDNTMFLLERHIRASGLDNRIGAEPSRKSTGEEFWGMRKPGINHEHC